MRLKGSCSSTGMLHVYVSLKMAAVRTSSASRPRLLLVDNYDSYTYNLFQYIAVVCGITPEVIKNTDPKGRDPSFLAGFDGVEEQRGQHQKL